MTYNALVQLACTQKPHVFTASSRTRHVTQPNSNSKLFDLPPEVRNKIYEILFKFSEPVAFLPLEEQVRLRVNHVEIDEHPAELKYYVAVLRTCRQIYSEAGGVLYGSNKFQFAHARSVKHDRNLNYIVHACARWLKSIESRIGLLRTVIVTINDTTESEGFSLINSGHNYHDCFDILPLLRFYWSDSNRNLRIQFKDSLDVSKMISATNRAQLYKPVNTDILHNVLHQLGRGNIWNLERSCSFLRSVLIQRYGFHGYVCYRSTGPRIGFLRKFNILDGGRELRLFHPQKPSGLPKMPKYLQHRIVTEVAGSEYVEYNTGRSKWRKHQIGLLNVCKSLRKDWTGPVTWNCKFMLNTYAQSESSHFHKAGPFGNARWLLNLRKDVSKQFQKEAVRNYQYRIPCKSSKVGNSTPPTIVLTLQPGTAIALSGITISATRLHQLEHFPSSTPVSFRLSSTTTDRNLIDQFNITLGEIVRRSFLLLSDIYFDHSSWAYYDRKVDVHVDGHGMPLYAILHVDSEDQQQLIIPNRRTRTKSSDVPTLVSGRIARLKNDWITARFNQDGNTWKRDLTTMLGCFRKLCMKYEDHKASTDTESQTEDVDICGFDGVHEHVFSIRKDIEGVNFRAWEFQQMNWRETLSYRTKEGKECPSKAVILPPPILQETPHYGCGGCTSKCVRGTIGPDKLLKWRGATAQQ